jgi:hypothetical protein
MFDELTRLNVQTIRCGIGIMHEPNNLEVWTAKPSGNGKADLVVGHLDTRLHPLLEEGLRGWKNKKKHFSYELKGDDLEKYFSAINNYPGYPVKYDIKLLPPQIIHNDFYFSEGTLFAFSGAPPASRSVRNFKTFSPAYSDKPTGATLICSELNKTQGKATIEAALEKVRGKAMAMHNSNDLSITASMVFTELRKLGINPIRCGVGLLTKETLKAQLFSATSGCRW